jgi:hypothetical protein
MFACDAVAATSWANNDKFDQKDLKVFTEPLLVFKDTYKLELLSTGSTSVVEGEVLAQQPKLKLTDDSKPLAGRVITAVITGFNG